MIALVGSVLAASLLGSPHCAGMCGGFVCFYSGQEGKGRRLLAHAAYSGGRLVSYALLGIAAGLFGAGIERAGAVVGVGRAAAVLAGSLMILWGGAHLFLALGGRLPGSGSPTILRGSLAGALRAVHAQPPAVRALVVGLLSTLLPCGWLYLFVATAAGTGSPWGGALVMAAFWAGTVPVMAGLGLAVQGALGPLRRRLPIVTAAAVVILGLLTVTGKMAAPHSAARHGTEHVGH